MADFNINNCPMCGAKARMDATGANEYNGKTWQHSIIECSECDMDLTLHVDTDQIFDVWDILLEAWNKISVKYKR